MYFASQYFWNLMKFIFILFNFKNVNWLLFFCWLWNLNDRHDGWNSDVIREISILKLETAQDKIYCLNFDCEVCKINHNLCTSIDFHPILWEILQLSSHYFILTLIRIMCYFHRCCTSLYCWCWRWFCFIIVTNKHFSLDSQILKGRCLFIRAHP